MTTNPAAASDGVIKLSQIHLPEIDAPLDLAAVLNKMSATPMALMTNKALTE
ncbi:MAG TPA: hypothetical protein PLS19_00200 [bacterium]|nr:hypothetical protein [bacterium]HPN92959.1 hypothetical protein [bacterium]